MTPENITKAIKLLEALKRCEELRAKCELRIRLAWTDSPEAVWCEEVEFSTPDEIACLSDATINAINWRRKWLLGALNELGVTIE